MVESSSSSQSFSLQVNVRVRPFHKLPGHTGASLGSGAKDSVTVQDGRFVTVQGHKMGAFKHVLNVGQDQEQVYDQLIQPFVDRFLDGYNCTIFLYGQTGSGKTHTLLGPPGFYSMPSPNWGICPRFIASMLSEGGPDITLTMSAVEIYFNDCFDLLNNKARIAISGFSIKAGLDTQQHMRLFTERDKDGKWVAPFKDGKAVNYERTYQTDGMKEEPIQSIDDVLKFMQVVEKTRSAKGHALNHRSSRSHCIVTLNSSIKKGKSMRQSKFQFVDLAGSERIKKTESEDMRAAEAVNINQSLHALGRVISELSKKGSGKGVVPYRESALTMLMKNSLSGNCKTSVIVTIANDPEMEGESLSSLRFGMTCGHLKTKAVTKTVNVDDSLSKLRAEVQSLDSKLAALKARGEHGILNLEHRQVTVDGFVSNYQRMKEAEDIVAAMKSGAIPKNAQNEMYQQGQINNLKGILMRQITTGIFTEPSEGFLNALAKRRQVAAQLNELSGKVECPPHPLDSSTIDLKLSRLMKEYFQNL